MYRERTHSPGTLFLYRLKFKKLINGYRQFDPTRGTHYIVDLSLTDANHIEYIKRAELMRPLGLVEIVPMPFVTESTKVFLILPVYTDEQVDAIRFLNYANRTLFDKETHDKFELLITHVVTSKQELSQAPKRFGTLRHHADGLFRVRNQLTVTYHTILLPTSAASRSTHSTHILDYFEGKLRHDSLLFVTSPYTNIESDFLNRCRLNVIDGVQVFFPIAFHQYHPRIISRTHHPPDNTTVELHKSHGWFNSYAFDHMGLYLGDYSKLKASVQAKSASLSANVYDLLVQFTDLHMLRAPDQSLRVRYHPIACDSVKESNSVERSRCLAQKERGLASRSQLAMLIIENEQAEAAALKREEN